MIYVLHLDKSENLCILTSGNSVPSLVMNLVKNRHFELAQKVAGLDIDTNKVHKLAVDGKFHYVFNPTAY